MFIHIGNDHVVHTEDIISIIDCQAIENSVIMKTMLENQHSNKSVIGSASHAKSIVITNDFIFYSNVSVVTLTKRSSYQAGFDHHEICFEQEDDL